MDFLIASLSESSEEDQSEMSDDFEETVEDDDDDDDDEDPDYNPSDPMLNVAHTGSLDYEDDSDALPSLRQLIDDDDSEDLPSSRQLIDEDVQQFEDQPLEGLLHLEDLQPLEGLQPVVRVQPLVHVQQLDVQPGVSVANDNQNIEPSECTAVAETSLSASQRGSSDETCSICFDPWTNSSEHRLVSLRCGHLFGRSCITQWLKGQNARCPQCNARARKSEIRNIYARSIKVIDSSERDKALQDLMAENKLRRAAEMEAAQERMRHCLAVQECERLKRELMEAQKQLQESRSGLNRSKMSYNTRSKSAYFSLLQNINIVKDGGCRIINSGDLLGMLLVSQPSSNGLFQGFGFRKISTLDLKPCDFVLVHKKLIRDMAFHTHDGLVLTASIDKTLKITNVLTNTVVQTYNVDADVWSCAWDSDNSMYFYGGLKTGEAYVFDIRATNRHVCELPRFGTKTPVVSLQYLSKPVFSSCSNGGPIVGKLSDCALHQKTQTEGNYNLVPMPALGPYTCLSSGAPGNLLVSCRPSPKQPRISHTFCDFVTSASGELNCCPVRTVFGGRTQVQLTRSKIFSHPDNASSVLICAGDEDANGALVWDGVSGDVLGNLQTSSPVLDLAAMKCDQRFFLTALTSKSLQVYGWNHH